MPGDAPGSGTMGPCGVHMHLENRGERQDQMQNTDYYAPLIREVSLIVNMRRDDVRNSSKGTKVGDLAQLV